MMCRLTATLTGFSSRHGGVSRSPSAGAVARQHGEAPSSRKAAASSPPTMRALGRVPTGVIRRG